MSETDFQNVQNNLKDNVISMKPICNHVIILDTKINYFCAENNENYIYSCEKPYLVYYGN